MKQVVEILLLVASAKHFGTSQICACLRHQTFRHVGQWEWLHYCSCIELIKDVSQVGTGRGTIQYCINHTICACVAFSGWFLL